MADIGKQVDEKVNEIANTETAKKFGMNTTVIYIIGAMIVLVVLSKVFGF